MTPRQPQENADDIEHRIEQAVHEALAESVPEKSPEEQLRTELKQGVSSLPEVREPGAVDTTVELDRFEMYLRGPTAFTA